MRLRQLIHGKKFHDSTSAYLELFLNPTQAPAALCHTSHPLLPFLNPRHHRKPVWRRSYSTANKRQSITSNESNSSQITLESLLSSNEAKSRDEKQLIWRAWTGLSEDAQATKLVLLDSLLETLLTDDYRDARRLRSLLDSGKEHIDAQQRAFYSFWAHSLLHETDIAFRHFVNVPLETQLYYKDTFMQRCIKTGDWTTGIQLWQLICDKTRDSWLVLSGKSKLFALLKLIPNVHTLQFLQVIPSRKIPAFWPFVRRELIIFLATINDKQAIEILRGAINKCESISDEECSTVMRSLIRAGKAKEALEIYHEITASHSPPTSMQRMTNAAIQACAKIKDIPQFEELLKYELGTRDPNMDSFRNLRRAFTTVMTVYARLGQPADVERLLNLYISANLSPDVVMLGTLLQARVITLEVRKAREIFDTLDERYGVKPDKVLYNMLLNMYADCNDTKSVGEIMTALVEAGHKPDQFTVTAVIDLYAQRQDYEGAQRAFDLMIGQGIEPNVHIYGSLMNAYVQSGNIDGMREIARQIEIAEIRPNSVIMNILLKSLLIEGKPAEALLDLVERMAQFGVKPTAVSYASILQARVAAMKLEEAKLLFETLPRKGISPNEYHYTIIMVGCLKVRDYSTMKHYFKQMRAAGIKPNFVTQAVLLNAYVVQGSPQATKLADELLRSFITSKPVSDRTSTSVPRPTHSAGRFTVLMNQLPFSYSPERAKEIFRIFIKSMEGTDGRPDIKSLTAIMNAYRISGQSDEVLSIFRTIKKEADRLYQYFALPQSLPFDSDVPKGSTKVPVRQIPSGAKYVLATPLSILLDSLMEASSFENVENVWTEMTLDGYAFDTYNWNQYLRVLLRLKKFDEACQVVDTVLLPRRPADIDNTQGQLLSTSSVLQPPSDRGLEHVVPATGPLDSFDPSRYSDNKAQDIIKSKQRVSPLNTLPPGSSLHRDSITALSQAFASLQRHGHTKHQTSLQPPSPSQGASSTEAELASPSHASSSSAPTTSHESKHKAVPEDEKEPPYALWERLNRSYPRVMAALNAST